MNTSLFLNIHSLLIGSLGLRQFSRKELDVDISCYDTVLKTVEHRIEILENARNLISHRDINTCDTIEFYRQTLRYSEKQLPDERRSSLNHLQRQAWCTVSYRFLRYRNSFQFLRSRKASFLVKRLTPNIIFDLLSNKFEPIACLVLGSCPGTTAKISPCIAKETSTVWLNTSEDEIFRN